MNSGGTRYVLEHAEGLKRQHGHHVTLFCDVAGHDARKQLRTAELELCEIDTLSTNSARYWLTLPARIRSKRDRLRSDLAGYELIINSMFPMSWLVCDFPLPKVQICYEPYAFFHDKAFLRNFRIHHRIFFRLMALLYRSEDRAAARKMDRLLTVNATNIEKLRHEYGVTATAVYAGIDLSLYRRAAATEIDALRARFPGFPLLFHSTDLTGIKGSYPLLELIAELRESWPDIRLLVTIYVDDAAGTRTFLRKIRELGLQQHVEFLGCLPKEQLQLYYSAVDFVCQPSINQPASWPLKESIICGTPIIGGVESEEVKEYVNGVRIDVRNRQESIRKLGRLFEQRESLSVDASAEEYRREFSRERSVDRLNDIIIQQA